MSAQVSIDKQVGEFATFLRDNFVLAKMPRGADYADWWRDWTQANWELLVEASIPWGDRIRLEVYGDGAECHSPSSRVVFPDDLATHRIVCTPRQGLHFRDKLCDDAPIDLQELYLDRFVALDGSWFREAPPFDMVLAWVNDSPVVVSVEEVQFALAAMPTRG